MRHENWKFVFCEQRAALAIESGEDEWSAYSNALGRRFLKLDEFLKSNSAKAEENVPNPKLFP